MSVASAVLPAAAVLLAGAGQAAPVAPTEAAPVAARASTTGPGSPTGARPTNVPLAAKQKQGTGDSLDWAGYAVTGVPVTSVAGTWIQPTAVCSGKKVDQSAFWVGIDGYASTDPTVQQVGTDADCTKGTRKDPGGPSYYAWYEMYPGSIVVLPTSTHPVAPYDILTATVSGSGSSYTLSITDVGRWTYTTVQSAPTAPLDASAEWIAEAPTTCTGTRCKAVDLTDFGSVAFSGATADGEPIDSADFTEHQITMTKNKKGTIVKASTSPLVGGDAFTVMWVSV